MVEPSGLALTALARVVPGTKVLTGGVTDEILHVTNATVQPRRLVFSRAAYPGFHLALDGRALPLEIVDKTLLSVTIPPRTQGQLVLDYRPPLLLATAALALAGLLLVAWLARRHRVG